MATVQITEDDGSVVEYADDTGVSTGFVMRRDPTDEWEAIQPSTAVLVQMGIEKAMADERRDRGPTARPVVIRRAGVNQDMAEELGLTGDEFAERLTDGTNLGTKARVSEERMDEIAVNLGLGSSEIRERFAGTYVSPE